MEHSQRLMQTVPMEVTMNDTVAIALNEEQNNDCMIVSYSSNEGDITETQNVMAKRRKILDDTFAPLHSVKNNVLQ